MRSEVKKKTESCLIIITITYRKCLLIKDLKKKVGN